MTNTEPAPQSVAINNAGTEVSYLSYEGGEPPIIFLHATGFMPGIWHPIARVFAGRNRVICPYFCDHRHADPHQGGLSWLQLAEDMAGICQALSLQTPLFVGHSMGGAVATLAAGRFGINPGKMVLIEPIFLPSELYNIELRVEDHPLAGKSIKRRNFWKNRQEARDYLKSRPLFANWDEEMMEMYLNHGFQNKAADGLALACHPEREASLFMGSMAYNPWHVLPDIACPVLLLEGEHSENRNFIDLKNAADRFPHGTHQVVAGAGHLIPMEKPAEITAIIQDFLTIG